MQVNFSTDALAQLRKTRTNLWVRMNVMASKGTLSHRPTRVALTVSRAMSERGGTLRPGIVLDAVRRSL